MYLDKYNVCIFQYIIHKTIYMNDLHYVHDIHYSVILLSINYYEEKQKKKREKTQKYEMKRHKYVTYIQLNLLFSIALTFSIHRAFLFLFLELSAVFFCFFVFFLILFLFWVMTFYFIVHIYKFYLLLFNLLRILFITSWFFFTSDLTIWLVTLMCMSVTIEWL